MRGETMFRRIFLIFNNEDTGYDKGNKPSGYARLEVRGSTGKMHVAVQNLKPGEDAYKYGVYLLRTDPKGFAAAHAGFLNHKPNKAEMEWSFDPDDIALSGCGIEEIDCIVILVEFPGRVKSTVICPLAAYKKGKVPWREKFKTYMIKRKGQLPLAEEGMQGVIADGSQQDSEPVIATIGITDIKEPDLLQPQGESAVLPGEMTNLLPLQGVGVDTGLSEREEEDFLEGQREGGEHAAEKEGYASGETVSIKKDERGPEPDGDEKGSYLSESGRGPELGGDEKGSDLSESGRGPAIHTSVKGHDIHAGEKGFGSGSIVALKEELGRSFEEVDPFNSRRSDYRWWEIDNPVVLNDLLYKHGVPSLVMANPLAIMAHYKYRHLLVGVFAHKEAQKDYIVFGIPSTYMVDAKPFGEMSRWVQSDGGKAKYGAFGYWIAYVDPAGQ